MSAKALKWTDAWHTRAEYHHKLAACGSPANYKIYLAAAMRRGHKRFRSFKDIQVILRQSLTVTAQSYEHNHCFLMGRNQASGKLLVLILNSPIPTASVSQAFEVRHGKLVYLLHAPTIAAVGRLIEMFIGSVAGVLVFNEITACFTVSEINTKVVNSTLVDAIDGDFRFAMQSAVMAFVRKIALERNCGLIAVATHSGMWRPFPSGKCGLNPALFFDVKAHGKVCSARAAPGSTVTVLTCYHPSRCTPLFTHDAAVKVRNLIVCLELADSIVMRPLPLLPQSKFRCRLPANYPFRYSLCAALCAVAWVSFLHKYTGEGRVVVVLAFRRENCTVK